MDVDGPIIKARLASHDAPIIKERLQSHEGPMIKERLQCEDAPFIKGRASVDTPIIKERLTPPQPAAGSAHVAGHTSTPRSPALGRLHTYISQEQERLKAWLDNRKQGKGGSDEEVRRAAS